MVTRLKWLLVVFRRSPLHEQWLDLLIVTSLCCYIFMGVYIVHLFVFPSNWLFMIFSRCVIYNRYFDSRIFTLLFMMKIFKFFQTEILVIMCNQHRIPGWRKVYWVSHASLHGSRPSLWFISTSHDKSLEIHCRDYETISARCREQSLFARKSYVPRRVVTSVTMRRR